VFGLGAADEAWHGLAGKEMSVSKTIAFFPEAAFGPALNSVGIAQACRDLGHEPVFITDPGMAGVFESYGFKEHHVNMSAPLPPEEMANYWSDFINAHIPNFNKTPYEQIDNYVKECWESIVDTAKWAQKELPGILDSIAPDLICIDNVILFPATKQYGVPWVRIISCSENEIPDPLVPPHLSGCAVGDYASYEKYQRRFDEVIAPIHADFNKFLEACGEAPYPAGEFFEESPFLNLLLYPEPVKFERQHPLDAKRFVYLQGCVREEETYTVPDMGEANGQPLIYVSFGSLGAGDVALFKRLIEVLGKLPYRALINVGDYVDEYSRDALPTNVYIDKWFPQPSVIPQADVVIHHGGNNSFTECLYFGKPAIIMPYVWDGHDNATRVEESGHGFKLHRSEWSDDVLAGKIAQCLSDRPMQEKLAATSAHMQASDGRKTAANLLDELLKEQN
jgi:MGT family glycosyltransferase